MTTGLGRDGPPRSTARAALCLALGLVFGAMAGVAEAGQERCRPDFPLKDGWLGGDGVYSVPLSDDQSLWLFGDSFVGAPEASRRRDTTLVSNSVALSRCENGRWSITYHWRKTATGHAPLFMPAGETADHGAVRYWPLDGILRDGILSLFMMRVETVEASNPFGFKITGTDLLRIGNPTAPPEAWHARAHALARDGALMGSGVLKEDAHLLLATPLEMQGHPMILTRLPLDGLDDPAQGIETLLQSGVWIQGLAVERAGHVIASASSELSIDAHPNGSQWIAVHMDPAPFSSRIVARTAPTPAGPWSPMRRLLAIPEAHGPGADGVVCYAGKAHHQIHRPGSDQMLVTYACNAGTFDRLLDDLTLYRPRVVELPLP